MSRPLKQSTAVTVIIGPFIDDTDGKTLETGLTVTSMTADLFKDDATEVSITITASGGSNDCVHVAQGLYSLELTTTDTNTLGYLRLMVSISGALPVWEDFVVLPANVYDTMYGSEKFDVNVAEISDDSTAADNLESACDNYSATRGLAGTALPAAAADAAGGLPISDAGGLDLDTKLANTNEVTAARMGALTDWINGGRLDLILDELTTQGDTNETKLDTIAGYIDTEIGDIQSRLPAALVGGRMSSDAVAISGSTAAADAVEANISNLDASIATVDTVVDGIQTDLDNGTDGLGALKTLIDALNDISAADVWDATEAITGNTLSFETIMARLYRFLFNKMNITDASGAVALRNEADDGDIMTNTITDNDTTTVRTAGSWS